MRVFKFERIDVSNSQTQIEELFSLAEWDHLGEAFYLRLKSEHEIKSNFPVVVRAFNSEVVVNPTWGTHRLEHDTCGKFQPDSVILTPVQTAKVPRVVLIPYGGKYWDLDEVALPQLGRCSTSVNEEAEPEAQNKVRVSSINEKLNAPWHLQYETWEFPDSGKKFECNPIARTIHLILEGKGWCRKHNGDYIPIDSDMTLFASPGEKYALMGKGLKLDTIVVANN